MMTATVLYTRDWAFEYSMGMTAAVEQGRDHTIDPDRYCSIVVRVYDKPEDDAKVLNGTYRTMNAVDGDELCCQLRVRSMSVGDIVRIERDRQVEYHMVLGAGFGKLSLARKEELERYFFPAGPNAVVDLPFVMA